MVDIIRGIIEKLNNDLTNEQQKSQDLDNFIKIKHLIEEIYHSIKDNNDKQLPTLLNELKELHYLNKSKLDEKISNLINQYLKFSQEDLVYKQYINYYAISKDLEQNIEKEIKKYDSVKSNIEKINSLNKYLDNLLQKIVNNNYLDIDNQTLNDILNYLSDNETYEFMNDIIIYNNRIYEDALKRKNEEIEKLKQEEIEILDLNEKELPKKEIFPEEEPIIEEIALEEQIINPIDNLSSSSASIYETIKSMLANNNPKEEINNYITTVKTWGILYLKQISSYCQRNNNETNSLIANYISKNIEESIDNEQVLDSNNDKAILLFKGYEGTTSLIEKDIFELNNPDYLEGVKQYLTELNNKNINIANETYSNTGLLKGSYHKKSSKAVRLSYEIIGQGIYYIYDVDVKKSDNGKKEKEKAINRRPNVYTKQKIIADLQNPKTKETIIERNNQIYNNIMKYIKECTNSYDDYNEVFRGGAR